MNSITTVAELSTLTEGVSRNPITVPISSVRVDEEFVYLGRGTEERRFDRDGVATQKIADFLPLVSTRYIEKCPPELQSANLNYWLNNSGEGEVSFYTHGDHINGLSDPNKLSIPLVSWVDSITKVFKPTDEVKKLVVEDNYLHVDITIPEISVQVEGHDSTRERKPRVNDITQGGIRILTFPDEQKPPVVQSYLHRLVCTNGLSQESAASRISLRGKTTEDIKEEFEMITQSLIGDLERVLEEYAATAEIRVVGDLSAFIFNVATERNLPQKVVQRVMELSRSLEPQPYVYDVLQIFTSVANESVSYPTMMSLQRIGGDFVNHEESGILHRCTTCEQPLIHNWDAV